MTAFTLLVSSIFLQADPDPMRLAMEAQKLYVSKDYGAAKERAEAGAKAGSPDAMILLGVIYSSGNGALRDYGEALRWYRRAADAGSAVAMYNLALLYQDGRGALKDTAEAERWFRAAADAGYAPATPKVPQSNVAGTTPARVSAPTVRVREDPKYSEQARIMLVTGTVVVSVTVGTDGIPRDLRVVNPLGFGLDEKAIEAAAAWRFNPGMKDGHPVNVLARIEVNFRLDKSAERDRWRGGQMAFESVGPVVLSTSQPLRGSKNQNESVSFEFTVNPSGHASDIHILHGSGSGAVDELTQQLSGWTFDAISSGAKGRVRFILNDGDEDAKQPLYPPKPAR